MAGDPRVARWRAVASTALGWAALAAWGPGCSQPEPPRPRGVLLVSIDSLRADHLSSYGYRSPTAPDEPTSPRIDAEVAASGMSFDQAVSTTSWTLPAHMALLTGQLDELHGVTLPSRLHPSHPLLAEVLAEAGWRTAGFFSGPNLHPWYGFDRGFERYVDCSNAPIENAALFDLEDPDSLRAMKDAQRDSHQGITSPEVVEAFADWWGTVDQGEPFLAFVHLWDVHFDYAAPAEHDVFYPGYAGDLDGANFWRLEQQDPRPPDDVARLRSLYDAEIRFTDLHVGRLLELLRASGRLDDTLVIVTSDHGEEFFEHGHFGHNRTLFEEVVRVPLIVRWPGQVQVGRTDEVVSLADVMPTVLDLAGVAAPPGLWGRSFAPLLRGEPLERRPAPMELALRREPGDPLLGLRAHDHKVVRGLLAEGAELYDLRADPGEQRPLVQGDALAANDPRVIRAQEVWRQILVRAKQLHRAVMEELPEGLQQRLQGLGYTDGAAAPEESR